MRCSGARLALAAVLVVVGAGCATQKKAAQTAIGTADSALKVVATDAQAYVPDLYKAAGAQLTAAKTDFDGAKYADALTKAQQAATQAGDLAKAVTAKKSEFAVTWKALSDSVPGMLKAIQARVDELAKMRRLPVGVTKEGVAGAKKALQEMNTAWTGAQTAYQGGKVAEAVGQAGTVKARVAQTKSTLGMKK